MAHITIFLPDGKAEDHSTQRWNIKDGVLFLESEATASIPAREIKTNLPFLIREEKQIAKKSAKVGRPSGPCPRTGTGWS